MPKTPDISSAEKAYEARYGHRQDILHDPFDRGWNMGWAACEARYREAIKAAENAEYTWRTSLDDSETYAAMDDLRSALAALSENGEEAKG